ncbi:PDR/VanB family oxidoreductase [Massilia sp. GCM10023247]|uniref:PDR/VanB family oxidoreductase n=1 Tax=Massilia sp. GCM10023247 TaxID=3252643 RepID=UPI00362181CF
MNENLLKLRVVRKVEAAQDIVAFELQAPDGAALPRFEAGAHIDVHLPNGLVRQYSLCNDARERERYRICVLRDPATRGGSAAMHDLVNDGDELTIGLPRNLFALVPGAHDSLLLAGGIGVTPILSMAWQLHAEQAPFRMHYFTRSRVRTAFHDELQAAPFAASTAVWFDDAETARPSVPELLRAASPGTQVYACGPAGFLEYVTRSAQECGLAPESLHIEAFGAAPMAPGAAFEVRLRQSGRAIRIGPEQTVVEALAAHGVAIPVSCEQGICGTCLTRVISGIPEHRDQYLSDEEHSRNDQFTPCCSRSLTPVLELDI